MDLSTYIIPFTLAQSDNFLMESSGIIRLEATHLVMEYQSRDAVLGMVKSGVNEVRLSLNDVQHITFKKGFFSSTLRIQAKAMRAFQKVPGSIQGAVELKIKRADRKNTEYMVSAANLRMSEMRLEAMGEIDD
jgi:hypothetical protein